MPQKVPISTTLTIPEMPKAFSFRRLTAQDWSWIHFKVALLVWAIFLFKFTPTAVSHALGAVSIVAASVCIFGVLLSLIGLVMSAQPDRIGLLGLSIEYSGLIFTAAGPITYFIVQVYLASTLPTGDQRIALCALGYVVCAALFARFRIVHRRRKKAMSVGEQVN